MRGRKATKKAATKPKRKAVKAARKPTRKAKAKDPFSAYDASIASKGVLEVLRLSGDDCLANVPGFISSQSLELDRLLNGVGAPMGRLMEIFGPWHIGKSTLLDHFFAEVQKMGGLGVLFDVEGARDKQYTRRIGVNVEELRYMEFDREALHIENVITKIFESIEFWTKEAPDIPVVIGWDALGGTATREELDKRLEKDTSPGMAASVLRKAARQLPAKLGNTKISVIICNHEYETFAKGGGFGVKKKETYGGGAIRHLASIRLKLHNMGWIKKSDGAVVGRMVGAKLIKNRLGNPWGEALLPLISGVGVDNTISIYEKLKATGLITISGSWAAINLDGEIINFQGWLGLAQKFLEDETIFPRLVAVYKSLG